MTTSSGHIHEEYRNEFSKFDKDTKALCKKRIGYESKNKKYSLDLKQNWMDAGLIDIDPSYDEVVINKVLMKTLRWYLACGLSTRNDTSNYGKP